MKQVSNSDLQASLAEMREAGDELERTINKYRAQNKKNYAAALKQLDQLGEITQETKQAIRDTDIKQRFLEKAAQGNDQHSPQSVRELIRWEPKQATKMVDPFQGING